VDFLTRGKHLVLIEITDTIAITAAELRGRYTFLKTMDALQLAAAREAGADAFVTNDAKLKRVKALNVIVLGDYA
jgi:predicted nucleic acid-binding protein